MNIGGCLLRTLVFFVAVVSLALLPPVGFAIIMGLLAAADELRKKE